MSETFQQPPAPAQPQPAFVTPAAPVTPVVAQTVEHIALPGVGVVRLASLGSRAGARLLDCVVVVVAYWVLAAVGFAGMVGAANAGGMTDQSIFGSLGSLGAFVGFLLLLGVLNVCYEAGMTAWKGATVGKMLMSIRVASTRTGGKPSVGGSVVRWVLPLVGSCFFGFGQLLVLLSPLFDGTGRRQGWHDRMASTVVVRSR